MTSNETQSSVIDALLDVMAALRTPKTGCPWDLDQTFETIAPYTIEEAYEVADAIERGDRDDLKDELGDLLLQVVYHARIAEEEGSFRFDDVVRSITEKMIRRHPHVFASDDVNDAAAMTLKWEDIKAEERALKAAARGDSSPDEVVGVLDGVALPLPALTRAAKLQKKASRVGFDWDTPAPVIAKVREELAEVEGAIGDADRAAMRDEIGDLLFTVTNLARHLDVDAEQALKDANHKFTRRFQYIESELRKSGRSTADADIDELESFWSQAKRELSDR